jgi:hypothetical protein
MDISRLLARMAWWLRHPPSKRQLIAIFVVAVGAAVLVTIERTIGWPNG